MSNLNKVFQTNTEHLKGNCLDACVATLLGLELDEIPHFNDSDDWAQAFVDFLNEKGYIYEGCIANPNYHYLKGNSENINNDFHVKNCLNGSDGESVSGLYLAGVLSPNHYKKGSEPPFPQHQVIINKNGVIVHDPHPGYQKIMLDNIYPEKEILGSNGIFDVFLIRKSKII